jgi:hypothetical protein
LNADELQELQGKIDYPMNRQAILDCIASHASGHDRHDPAIITADASGLQHPIFKEQGYSRGTRDTRDLSYVRPLLIDTPAPQLS